MKGKHKVLDLFAGIGGFSLGLQRTGGFETVAFCEIEPFCQKVLHKHWPDVPIYGDVRELTGERLESDGIAVDVITGGFPCQDISVAGKGAGITGERSGLWTELARLIGEIRPRYAILENVSALLGRGLSRVLGDLAEIGYDAEWDCISASAVGAPHRRDRIWIVAYPARAQPHEAWQGHDRKRRSSERLGGGGREVADAERLRKLQPKRRKQDEWRRARYSSWWSAEPDVGRVAHGIPRRVDRLKSLGNSVVPQIPEMIGNAILSAEQEAAA